MKHNRTRYDTLATILYPACLGIGTAVGALIHNIGVGLAIGAGIGSIFSLIVYYLGRNGSDQEGKSDG